MRNYVRNDSHLKLASLLSSVTFLVKSTNLLKSCVSSYQEFVNIHVESISVDRQSHSLCLNIHKLLVIIRESRPCGYRNDNKLSPLPSPGPSAREPVVIGMIINYHSFPAEDLLLLETNSKNKNMGSVLDVMTCF